jgi:hypothetical protein
MNTNDQPLEALVRDLVDEVSRATFSESLEGMREAVQAAVGAFETARREQTPAGRWEALQDRVDSLHEDPPTPRVDPFDPYAFEAPESRR